MNAEAKQAIYDTFVEVLSTLTPEELNQLTMEPWLEIRER